MRVASMPLIPPPLNTMSISTTSGSCSPASAIASSGVCTGGPTSDSSSSSPTIVASASVRILWSSQISSDTVLAVGHSPSPPWEPDPEHRTPGGCLVERASPPWAWAIPRMMNSPSPEPCAPRSRSGASGRTSRTTSHGARRDARPPVADRRSTWSSASVRTVSGDRRGRRGEADRVVQPLADRLDEPAGVGRRPRSPGRPRIVDPVPPASASLHRLAHQRRDATSRRGVAPACPRRPSARARPGRRAGAAGPTPPRSSR